MKQMKEIKQLDNIVMFSARQHAPATHTDIQYLDVKQWIDTSHTQKSDIQALAQEIRDIKASCRCTRDKLKCRKTIAGLRHDLALRWKEYKQSHRRSNTLYKQYMAQLSQPKQRYAANETISMAA